MNKLVVFLVVMVVVSLGFVVKAEVDVTQNSTLSDSSSLLSHHLCKCRMLIYKTMLLAKGVTSKSVQEARYLLKRLSEDIVIECEPLVDLVSQETCRSLANDIIIQSQLCKQAVFQKRWKDVPACLAATSFLAEKLEGCLCNQNEQHLGNIVVIQGVVFSVLIASFAHLMRSSSSEPLLVKQ